MIEPPNLQRHFLSWTQPLLPQAVALLAGDWAGGEPLDLARTLVIVPTRQSGRRLREALAVHAAMQGQAVFPPRVHSPISLISDQLPPDTASRLESLLAWTEVLGELDLAAMRDLFPVDPPTQNFSWALRLARDFTRLQATLAEAGLRLGEVGAKAGDGFPEAARWNQIAELEQRQAEKLAARSRCDGQSAKILAARDPARLEDVDRVVLLATPDPMPLALTLLSAHAARIPIEVAIFAEAAEAGSFDRWGRPLPAVWMNRVLDWPDLEERVQLLANPAAQAAHLAALAHDYAAPEGLLGLGVADPEILPLLENELSRGGRAAFNPEGRTRLHDGFYQLLSALALLQREPTFDAVEGLARCPDFLACLAAREARGFSPARWLDGLDQLRARHLPSDLDAALAHADSPVRFPELAVGLARIKELHGVLTGGKFSARVSAALLLVLAERRLDLAREDDAQLEAAMGVWMEILRECAAAETHFPKLSPDEWWDLALRLYGEASRTDEKPAGALELQGWLELLWEDAPHLVVSGFNDGRVPDAVAGDPFLPESLREKLGLKTNGDRFARDAYLLQALVTARARDGRLDLLLGKTSSVGEPLRPSRLLFRCPDLALPGRVAFLFGPSPPVGVNLAWQRAWRLEPRRVEPPARVAVTALRGYLNCPWRFYLRHGLGMEPVEAEKSELDARDFGTLCHSALERLADPDLRECLEVEVLRSNLLEYFERQVRTRYGTKLALPLVIQLESARQRLSKAAGVEVAERLAGWVCEQVERKFTLEISGLVVSGKIDRIDRHPETGAVRVLDYKTSDVRATPPDSHLRPVRPGETPPEWAVFSGWGRPRVWSDLQLPLYRRALAAEFPAGITCGYFNLPKAAGETGITVWQDYTRELESSAGRCAEAACAAIRAGRFWPPNETVRPKFDEFASLFHHGVAESVAWEEKP